jgi:foldase protein PrsA
MTRRTSMRTIAQARKLLDCNVKNTAWIHRHPRPVAIALVALLVLVGVVAAGCSTVASTPSTAIAVVNGVEIPKSAVDTKIAQMKKSSPASFEGTAGVLAEQQYRAQTLNTLIQNELIKEAAKTLGVSVTTGQVDSYVSQLQKQYGGANALDTAMKSAGFTTATFREQVSDNLLTNAVEAKVATGTINVSDAQSKSYYDKNRSQFSTPAQVHVEQILIAATDTVLAKSLYTQSKAGADFATLAKKYSTDPGSKTVGGDLGWTVPSSYVAQFAVQTMNIGEVRLVKSQDGWHIIKLLGRRPAAQQTFAQATVVVKQMLGQTARFQQFNAYITSLRQKAKIQILDANLKKIVNANNAMNVVGSTVATSGK